MAAPRWAVSRPNLWYLCRVLVAEWAYIDTAEAADYASWLRAAAKELRADAELGDNHRWSDGPGTPPIPEAISACMLALCERTPGGAAVFVDLAALWLERYAGGEAGSGDLAALRLERYAGGEAGSGDE